jgi:hypothetical protein
MRTDLRRVYSLAMDERSLGVHTREIVIIGAVAIKMHKGLTKLMIRHGATRRGWLAIFLGAGVVCPSVLASEVSTAAGEFRKDVQPILAEFCYDCHGDGSKKGNVTLDEFDSDRALVENRELWWNVIKYLRAGIMPPEKKPRPSAQQRERIEQWVKNSVFGIDPNDPDPGRVTVRRLSRFEYRNTIRDLLGVEFNTEVEFPADDTGHGFDNIGDVLTLSPMLLEKYLAAARTIVEKARANRPEKFTRFIGKDAPAEGPARHKRTTEVLEKFASAAFRRPVDAKTVERLVALAEAADSHPGAGFEDGIAQAMMAVLASPRFLFREEGIMSTKEGSHPYVDDYSLASRLSYFLWSSMPDAELFELAAHSKLRANLSAQVERLFRDQRSQAFILNFVGQWLQARDIDNVPIEARAVLARDAEFDPDRERMRARFRELRDKRDEELTEAEKAELEKIRTEFFRNRRGLRAEMTGELRGSMRRETEKYFEYVVRENRSIRELIDSDYTFLNERLATHYGLTNVDVKGQELRRVTLPKDSARGGVLTHGTVLAVTSNPNRTSPVKRGLFILDNILGTPPPPPPPDVPSLDDAAKDTANRPLSLRESLEIHRAQPLCNSCHNRMDPLGLALENFNAMGMWREKERSQPIDATGKLITGESFKNVSELKRILANERHLDFYRCLTEKLLTYAMGRGLDYYDVHTVDQIVTRLEKEDGRFSALLLGIVESAPFQKRRNVSISGQADAGSARGVEQRAEIGKNANEHKN